MRAKHLPKSYVWHGDQCFAVWTAREESSAVLAYGDPVSRTVAYECSFVDGKEVLGAFVGVRIDHPDSIAGHLELVKNIFYRGNPLG